MHRQVLSASVRSRPPAVTWLGSPLAAQVASLWLGTLWRSESWVSLRCGVVYAARSQSRMSQSPTWEPESSTSSESLLRTRSAWVTPWWSVRPWCHDLHLTHQVSAHHFDPHLAHRVSFYNFDLHLIILTFIWPTGSFYTIWPPFDPKSQFFK